MANNQAATFNIGCDSGSLISGGYDVGEPIIGVTVDTDGPGRQPAQ